MRKFLHVLVSKPFVISMTVLVEMSMIIYAIYYLSLRFLQVYSILVLLSIITVIYLVNKTENPSYKLSWAVLILTVPLIGGVMYLLFGGKKIPKALRIGVIKLTNDDAPVLKQDRRLLENIYEYDVNLGKQANYIWRNAYYPIYEKTNVTYLPLGEVKFTHMLQELEKAEKFIFLEYFIIHKGLMWGSILDILKRKVKEGVDVRVMFDDGGSLGVPYGYEHEIRKYGIKCYVFNPITLRLAVQMNNRDHRKICVIDGKVGFIGGINLADEYINVYERFGYWKDTAIMIKGEAVFSLTVMFLQFYNYTAKTKDDYFAFKAPKEEMVEYQNAGYVQPFSDSPTDDEAVSETAHLNMINMAKRYVYIMTPYLVIGHEMILALSIAAKNGVDIRIMVPHIPDKWYVHAVSRSHYEELTKNGVRIFEYKPGFVHAKIMVSDDEAAIVGTTNMDYRSYYLHFECGVLIVNDPSVMVIKNDFLNTQVKCIEITYADTRKVNLFIRLGRALLNLFSALM